MAVAEAAVGAVEAAAAGRVECGAVVAECVVLSEEGAWAARQAGAEILEVALVVQVVISVVAEVPVAASMVEAVPAMPAGSTA